MVSVGLGVGAKEGSAVGLKDSDGAKVGLVEGDVVGAAVGLTDGKKVGKTVGSGLGFREKVGFRVGFSVYIAILKIQAKGAKGKDG